MRIADLKTSSPELSEDKIFASSIERSRIRYLVILICVAHFLTLSYLARQHPFGTYATETDFYHLYAPDAERIAAGQFPQNTFQGPGYPAVLTLIAKLTGAELFTAGKWFSVLCAVLCGLLTYILFSRLFNYWIGLGAQLLFIVSGEFPQFSINATTDVFFLLLCLAVLALLISDWLPERRRLALAGALTGIAYVTRYNGLFLLAICLLAIVLLNLYHQSWRQRGILAASFVLFFLITASPWLYANYKHRGSPFYNTNYLNIATEFYPELVAGKTNQDGTRALEQKFHSFADVIRYDPKRILLHYPVNLYESLRYSIDGNLVNRWVGWAALIGIIIVLIERRSKVVILVLIAGLSYLLLMALNHWEARYYFFVMILYAGFAVYAVSRLSGLVRAEKFKIVSIALFVFLWTVALSESRNDVTRFIASHPMEVIAARDYLDGVKPEEGRLRIVARKPHLPYLSHNEWVFFPQVDSLNELQAWVESNHIDYIVISKRELKERKELAPLGDPKRSPPWLKAAWMHENPMLILYKPETNNMNGRENAKHAK